MTGVISSIAVVFILDFSHRLLKVLSKYIKNHNVSKKGSSFAIRNIGGYVRFPMLSGYTATTAWRVLGLRIEETASRYGG
jgi:hypothetical protein